MERITLRLAIINITGGGMSGGYRKYLVNIIPRLASNPQVEELLCAFPSSLKARDWIGWIPNVIYTNCHPYNIFDHLMSYGIDKQLKRDLETFSPDVIFTPVDRQFRFNNVPVVNMVRNMEPFVDGIDGDTFTGRLKKRIRYIDSKKAVEKADKVIAVSGFVRDFLLNKWKIPEDKISLIYYGRNDPVRSEEASASGGVPADWLGKFLFTAGSIRPARGLEDVLWAIKNLSGETDVRGLIIAGDTSPDMVWYRRRLEEWVKVQGLSSRVCWAGGLDENRMAWCYRNCSVFVMTSRVESFGMIGVEAMSYGCVCVVADNPCMPEIFGDAAVYYSTKDGKNLSEKIQTVLGWDDEKRNEMSRKAKTRAEEFSWDVTAEKTIEVLKMAMETR